MRSIWHLARCVLLLSVMALGSKALAQSGETDLQKIELSTGEILNVHIVSETDDTITFVHPLLGQITLPKANVKILPPPEPPQNPGQAEAEVAVQTEAGAAAQVANAGAPSAPQTQPTTAPETQPNPVLAGQERDHLPT